MGVLNRLIANRKQLQRQADALLDRHGDKVSDGIDTAARLADTRTGGRHTAKIDKAATRARTYVEGRRPRPGGGSG